MGQAKPGHLEPPAKGCRGHLVDTKRRLGNRIVSSHTCARRNCIHWSEEVAKAEGRHERFVASKEGGV